MLRIVHTGCGAIEGIAHRNPRSRSSAVSRSPRRRSATCAGAHPSRWQLGRARWRRTTSPPACPQPTPGDSNEFYDREWGTDPAIALDEDCLYLNVWTPRCAAATRTHTGERIARCR